MNDFFVCIKLIDNVCSEWVLNSELGYSTISSLLNVDVDTGMKIGGMFFGLCVFAWIGRLLLIQLSRM